MDSDEQYLQISQLKRLFGEGKIPNSNLRVIPYTVQNLKRFCIF